MIHVYGITRSGAKLPQAMDGLGDRPVRLVESGGLAAVVTDLDEKPRSRADLARHADVQSAIVAQTGIVPLRFGTLMDDEQELHEGLLGSHAEELEELLGSVEDSVQMTVKAVYHEGQSIREAIAAHPELKRRSDQLKAGGGMEANRDAWVDLGQKVAQAVEARREADEASIVERLEPHAVHVIVEEPGHERMAARLQLLVARDRRAELDEVVDALAGEQEQRMLIRYVGPLAPYSFCDVSLDAGAAAWG